MREDMAEQAAAFTDADKDADNMLDFEEFVSILPARTRATHTEASLRDWFSMLDTDGSGKVDMSEFFLFTVQTAAWRAGTGISALFNTYDQDGSGQLDKAEFTRSLVAMGFGEVAVELFSFLDSDHSDTVHPVEVISSVRVHAASPLLKSFMVRHGM